MRSNTLKVSHNENYIYDEKDKLRQGRYSDSSNKEIQNDLKDSIIQENKDTGNILDNMAIDTQNAPKNSVIQENKDSVNTLPDKIRDHMALDIEKEHIYNIMPNHERQYKKHRYNGLSPLMVLIKDSQESYYSICDYYYDNAKWFSENYPDHDLVALQLSKRAVQRYAIQQYFLQNKLLPNLPLELIVECTQQDFEKYQETDTGSKFVHYIKDNFKIARDFYNQVLEKAKIAFESYEDDIIKDILKDDMNTILPKLLAASITNIIHYMYKQVYILKQEKYTDEKLNRCLYLSEIAGMDNCMRSYVKVLIESEGDGNFFLRKKSMTDHDKDIKIGILRKFLKKKII